MKIAIAILFISASFAFFATGTYAQPAHAPHRLAAASPASDLASGEVRKIDKDAKKITLRHGEIKSLDMPPMTMVFKVKDPAMLDLVQVGDKVRFKAENIGGAYTVTAIEAAK